MVKNIWGLNLHSCISLRLVFYIYLFFKPSSSFFGGGLRWVFVAVRGLF